MRNKLDMIVGVTCDSLFKQTHKMVFKILIESFLLRKNSSQVFGMRG